MKKVLSKIDQGVIYMVMASFFFAIVGAFAKLLSREMPSIEVAFFRNLIGVVFIMMSLYKMPIVQQGGRIYLLLFRGLAGLIGLLAFFYNIAHISLADAMTFSRTSPIWTAVFAYMFLGERVGKKGWIAIFIGFIGIIFIMKPSGLAFDETDIIGLISGIAAALAYTSVRELRRFYDTRSIVLSFMIVGTIVPAIMMWIASFYDIPYIGVISGKFVMPSALSWLYILFLGGFATLAQIYMTKAYGVTKAGIVGAVSYTVILFSILVGVALGDALPDFAGTFGILLVILGGILVAFHKEKN
ncbi:DMT family transporter [Sulfurospirillum sp. 1612]|uniref:DMT family transporter n=1 Tax=Sulfurospirillum sp. 1612 TaxID=3094835 RepID=UPI002F930392